MTKEAQIYYAKKFYPHLALPYAVGCIRVSLKSHNIPYEEFHP